MDQENLEQQADEVAALSSIYGPQWCVLDPDIRRYEIQIDDENTTRSLKLEVQLPSDYPQNSPPTYQINAPWLRGQQRIDLSNNLEEIYLENAGESVLYQWIEKCREFLLDFSEETDFADLSRGELTSAESSICEGEKSSEDLSEELSLRTREELIIMEDEESCPEIFHGEFVHDRKSVFQAHLAAVTSAKDVQLVMRKLLENKKIAAATHNIQAYRISKETSGHPVCLNGCVDDGETHAGSRMLHLLEIVNAWNVLVVVTRWYGGVHLGPDRFKHINNCTRQILLDHGYIKEKDEKKKGPKSSKKGK